MGFSKVIHSLFHAPAVWGRLWVTGRLRLWDSRWVYSGQLSCSSRLYL